MFGLKEEVAGAEEPCGAQVGENQIFVVAQIFFDLGDVVFGIGVFAPDGVRAVALEKRLEFKRNQLARLFRQHEIHPAITGHDLTGGQKSKHIRA